MPLFLYEAIDQSGNIVKSSLFAESQEEAVDGIESSVGNVISIKEIKSKKTESNAFNILNLRGLKLSTREMIGIFVHLAEMDKAGVTILDSLEMLKDTSITKNQKIVATKLYVDLSSGKNLSESMLEQKSTFDPIFSGLVKVGEKTGNLGKVAGIIVDYIKWLAKIKSNIMKAFVKPTFSLIFIICLIIVMSAVVMPKMQDFLKDQDIEMPTYTKALIVFSNFVAKRWYIVLLVVTSIIISVKLLKRNKKIAYQIDALKLKIPFFGTLSFKIELSRFISFFSMMYDSGADIMEIFQTMRGVIKNEKVKVEVDNVAEKVRGGSAMFIAFEEARVFPIFFVKMIQIGEKTNSIGNTLRNVKEFYDADVDNAIDKVVSSIKPAMLIIMAFFVSWMAIGMFGPIYGNLATLSGGVKGGPGERVE